MAEETERRDQGQLAQGSEAEPAGSGSERLRDALKELEGLRKAAAERRAAAKPEYPYGNPPVPVPACEPPSTREPPQYDFYYRHPVELWDMLDPDDSDPAKTVMVACVPIHLGRLSLAADLRYDQNWRFQELLIGDLSASMSLAPGETVTLSIKKTQRTQLNQTTVDSSESLDSSESSAVDKDVLNVTRSNSNTQQWRVDGNAQISLAPGFTVNPSGGFSNSVSSTSNSTVEHVSETTQKSAHQLRTMQKIEVGRQSESLLETTQKRTFANPYRDRALVLNVFELYKHYSVVTQLDEIRPVLVLEIDDLALGYDFVVGNGDFLEGALLDRSLAAELRSALETVQKPYGSSEQAKAQRYARLAFQYLFEVSSVFVIDVESPAPDGPGGPDYDGPAVIWDTHKRDYPVNAFNAKDISDGYRNSGLNDAINNGLAKTFSALNYYYRLREYLKSGVAQQRHGDELDMYEIDLAVALADSVKDEWTAATAGEVGGVMDADADFTECFRRLSGFLSMVDNLLRPLLKPLDAEREAKLAADRANYVIGRVVAHLGCLKSYYVVQYLNYISNMSKRYAMADAVRQAVQQAAQLYGFPPSWIFQYFDLKAGFLDGLQFIVPLSERIDAKDALAWIANLTGQPEIKDDDGFHIAVDDLKIPTDGVHIEPAAGTCILKDVPPPTTSVSADIHISAEGVETAPA